MKSSTKQSVNAWEVLRRAFGPDANLYTDVLKISPDATIKQIRTAYFRRGREVLFEDSINEQTAEIQSNKDDDHFVAKAACCSSPVKRKCSNGSHSKNMFLSKEAKLKFEAVSYAYDILSNPVTRKQYDSTALIPTIKLNQEDEKRQEKDWKMAFDGGVELSTTGIGIPRRRRARNTVKWNDRFEELLIIDYSSKESGDETEDTWDDEESTDEESDSGFEPCVGCDSKRNTRMIIKDECLMDYENDGRHVECGKWITEDGTYYDNTPLRSYYNIKRSGFKHVSLFFAASIEELAFRVEDFSRSITDAFMIQDDELDGVIQVLRNDSLTSARHMTEKKQRERMFAYVALSDLTEDYY